MVRILEEGGLIAYPTDSCYALGCALGNASGIERIRRIRQLGDRHHFTLVIFGIGVAIPALLAYRGFRSRVDDFLVEMEQQSLRLVDVIKGIGGRH